MPAEQTPGDYCDNCGEFHPFDPAKDVIRLYWETVYCNHIETTCTACDTTSRIYVEWEAFVYVRSRVHLNMVFAKEADDELVTRRAALEDSTTLSNGAAKEPEVPVIWLRQMYDDIRRFEAGDTDDTG